MSCSSILRQSTHWTGDINILRYITRRSCRHASTSSNPYPYPTHPNPQPHQIFHLPRSATQRQIKERYYDLVRIYHPDSPVARHCPVDIAQARFQSVSKAYDLLRGRSTVAGETLTSCEPRPDPARFRPKAPRRPHFDQTAGDERWKERILFGATLLAIVAWVAQTTVARHKAIAQVTGGTRANSSGSAHVLPDEALAESTEPAGSPSR